MIAIYTVDGRLVYQNGNTRIVRNIDGTFRRETLKCGQWKRAHGARWYQTINAVEASLGLPITDFNTK